MKQMEKLTTQALREMENNSSMEFAMNEKKDGLTAYSLCSRESTISDYRYSVNVDYKRMTITVSKKHDNSEA